MCTSRHRPVFGWMQSCFCQNSSGMHPNTTSLQGDPVNLLTAGWSSYDLCWDKVGIPRRGNQQFQVAEQSTPKWTALACKRWLLMATQDPVFLALLPEEKPAACSMPPSDFLHASQLSRLSDKTKGPDHQEGFRRPLCPCVWFLCFCFLA